MTRGTDTNLAYVFTTPARPADPQPGSRPASELGRYERLRRERAGYLPDEPSPASPDRAAQREPIAVLADVLSRDGAELPGSAIRQRNLANADHLATLHAIWAAETQAARHDRYRDLVTAALPPGRRQPLSHPARWLYRTLHAAELAGLDPAEVIRTAIASRDLAGSRDVAAVLDARIRPRVDPLLPQRQGAWAGTGAPAARHGPARLPGPDRRDDGRPHPAPGPVRRPDHAFLGGQRPRPGPRRLPPRRQWEDKAASMAAYREMYGYDHPDDPIGPEPAREAPDQRAGWHQAFAALGPAGQPDVRALPDGQLWLARDTYAAQTAWAPPYAGKQLRLSRLGAFDAALAAIRADAETAAARKAGEYDRAARHETLAASYRALRDHYQQREHDLTQDTAARQEWEHATERSRRLAIAADAELRRRHPRRKIEPLRSAEPVPVSDTRCDPLQPAPDGKLTEIAALIRDLAVQREQFRAEMDERPGLIVPGDHGKAFRAMKTPGQDAILQPPKPEITPSARILQLAAEHDIEPEAGG